MTFKLTEDKQERKQTPIFSGVVAYFPLALAAVARVSWQGNEQHNPGEPLHWARAKSVDHMDAAARHQLEYAMGNELDSDGEAHLAKAMWRLGAQLQLDEEARLAKEGWREGTLWDKSEEPEKSPHVTLETRLPDTPVEEPTAEEWAEFAVKREDVHAQMRRLRLKDD